jgi:uncharacterized protein
MTNAEIYYKEDMPVGFHVEGHAGYAESGSDIICSAISVLTINTVNSVEKLIGDSFSLQTQEADGVMDFKLDEHCTRASVLLLKSLELGLEGIEDQYGKEFIHVTRNYI